MNFVSLMFKTTLKKSEKKSHKNYFVPLPLLISVFIPFFTTIFILILLSFFIYIGSDCKRLLAIANSRRRLLKSFL